MPEFQFSATDKSGQTIQGKTTSQDMGEAVSQVAAMGYTLLTVELVQQESIHPAQFPTAAGEQTTQMPAQPTQADLLKSDAETRRKVEEKMRSIGMSPVEIAKLVNANSAVYDDTSWQKASQKTTSSADLRPPPSKAKGNRVSAASLESFAAQLTSENAAKTNTAVREVNLQLPAFRESSTAEQIQAEALMRDANMLRRRNNYKEAEQKAREALNLTPSDAASLEFYGDVLQGSGRVDEAMAAYKRAVDADAKRASAERKYGDLVVQQQNWYVGETEDVEPNKWLNSILSLCLPGIGQVYNRNYIKAIVFFALDLICIFLVWHPTTEKAVKGHISTMSMVTFALIIITYVSALIDANVSAGKVRT